MHHTLTYPGWVDAVGQVVGPNNHGEFFVATDAEAVQVHTNITGDLRADTEHKTRVSFDLLSKDRMGLLTSEARQEFVAKAASIQGREAETGFTPVPEWPELGRFEREMLSPHLWDVR